MYKRLISSALASCIIFLVCFSANAASVGERAPEISLPLLDQAKVLSLKKYRGKVVYLDFWASWCGSCRVSLPLLSELRTELLNNGFEVFGVNVDAKPKDGIAFLDRFPVSFPVVSDPKGKTPELYQLKGMPTSYLIDKKGVIRHIHVGFKKSDMSKIKSEVLVLLNEK